MSACAKSNQIDERLREEQSDRGGTSLREPTPRTQFPCGRAARRQAPQGLPKGRHQSGRTANLALTFTASASRHSSTASMQRSSLSGGACAAIAATLVRHVRMVGLDGACDRRDEERVAEVRRQVDQCAVQRNRAKRASVATSAASQGLSAHLVAPRRAPAAPFPVPPAPRAVRSSSVSASLRSSVRAFASSSAVATISSAAAYARA